MKKLNKKKNILGIISIITAGVACIIPGGALIATIIGAPLIVFSWKNPILALLSGLINIINVIFLSPSMWFAMGLAEIDNSGGAISLGKAYLMVQIIAMFIMGILTFITWLSTKKK